MINSKTVTCVFVHGWAMNSAVLEESINRLPAWINVVLVDLPGHGSMAEVNAQALDDYVQALHPLVHRPVLWVGWSLGGLVVLRLAELYPQRVAAALLVATNPCFVQKPGWQSAVDTSVFDQFADDLKKDQDKTIRRSLALQVKGSSDAMRTVKKLQKSLLARGQASQQALVTGLNVLCDSDLRNSLSSIDCPLSWYLGAKDVLVPASLAQQLEQEYHQHDVVLHEQASHAPFVSHTDDFIKHLIAMAQVIRNS